MIALSIHCNSFPISILVNYAFLASIATCCGCPLIIFPLLLFMTSVLVSHDMLAGKSTMVSAISSKVPKIPDNSSNNCPQSCRKSMFCRRKTPLAATQLSNFRQETACLMSSSCCTPMEFFLVACCNSASMKPT